MSEAVMEAEATSTQEESVQDFLQDVGANSFEMEEEHQVDDQPPAEDNQVLQPEQSESEADTLSIDEYKAKLEAIQKRYDNAQQLISRQGQELGSLRPLMQQQQQEKIDPNKFLEDFANDPVKTQQQLIARELANREAQSTQIQMVALRNKGTVLSMVPEADSLIPKMKEWYAEKGATQEFVENLDKVIYNNVDLAVALAENIKHASEIASLKSELAKARGDVDGKIDKIQLIAKQGRRMTNAPRGGQPDTSIAGHDLTKMSDEALRQLLAQSQ